MSILDQLEPAPLWKYFEAICNIPRPSKNEEKIIAYLIGFAHQHHLEFKKDQAGNILIKKRASASKAHSPSIVLQSHMDMVCEKNSGTEHNFDTDPIRPYIDGNWVRARGTTLGADDGIGMAAMLAILSDPSIEHGTVECLFTVDEETGLAGAFALTSGFFDSKVLINLDSEDEGELFIGCAGGKDTLASFKSEVVPVNETYNSYIISLTGLQGGHSGDDIHRGLGNAVKIMSDFLFKANTRYKAGIHLFEGGNLKNVIPREAFATVLVPPALNDQFVQFYTSFFEEVRKKYAAIEPSISYSLAPAPTPQTQLSMDFAARLLSALNNCPHGVISWSQEIKGLVKTSTNLASVKFPGDNEVVVTTSQRSSDETEKHSIAKEVAKIFSDAGAAIQQSKGYPGWTPDLNSELLKVSKTAYAGLFGEEAKVKAIHAGLECGLFLEKYPGLDMISFGPTIKGAHSPDERLDIASVTKFWALLLEILKRI